MTPNLWRIRFERMELQRLAAKIQRLTGEAECYRLARDCYKVLMKYDERREEKGGLIYSE